MDARGVGKDTMTRPKAILSAISAAALAALAACSDNETAASEADAAPGTPAADTAEASAASDLPAFDRENAPVTWEPGEFATAWDQYQARRAAAQNPGDLDPANAPDWSGIWEQASFQGFYFSLRPGEEFAGRGFATVTTMKLTPRYAAEHEARIRQAEAGADFDPLTWCLPAGHPRWLVEPFMREFFPIQGTTLLINEMQNEVRHIYTDGRDISRQTTPIRCGRAIRSGSGMATRSSSTPIT